MGVSAVAIGAAAVLGANAVLRGAEREALDSGPEYIRDAQPEGLTKRLGLGIARAACRRYAANPGVMDPDPATSYETVCRPYLDNIGPDAGPRIDSEFDNGQCVGTYYFVTMRFYNSETGALTGQTVYEGFGPVSIGVGGNQAPGPGNPSPGPSFTYYPGRDLRFGGVPRISLGGTWAVRKPWEVASVVPRGNEPDNCGPPLPDVTQPEPVGDPDPGPEPVDPGNEFNFNFDVTVNLDGSINVDFGVGPFVINPFGRGGTPGEPGEPGSGGGPPGAAEPGAELPGGNGGFGGDDEFGLPPSGKRWVGACIKITTRPEGLGTIPGTAFDEVYPEVVGNARLVYNASGSRFSDTPVRMAGETTCLWESVRGLNPTGVRVNLKPGYGYSFTRYAQPLEN